MARRKHLPEHSWAAKFRRAFRGVKLGVRGQSSFFVHFFAASLVVAAAMALDADRTEWLLLAACIAAVLTAEMFNSALERLAKAVDTRFNPNVRDALDTASGAVLIAALGAATIGAVIFLRLVGENLRWW